MSLTKTIFIKQLQQKKYLIGAVLFLMADKSIYKDEYSIDIFNKCLEEYKDGGDISDQTEKILSLLLHKYIRYLSNGWRPAFIRKSASVPDECLKAHSRGKTIYCEFRIQDKDFFNKTVSFVKSLDGARWIPTKESWGVIYHYSTVEKLKKYGFSLSSELNSLYRYYNRASDDGRNNPIKVNGLKRKPFKYQLEGVSWIERCDGNAIIADTMGLGKSNQVLTWLTYHPEYRPVLIICPGFLKLNWKNEILMTMPDTMTNKIQVLDGFPKKNAKIYGEILISNYEILSNQINKKTKQIKRLGWNHYLNQVNINAAVLDEFHYCKNPKALRTKAVLDICASIDHIVALSGTPIVNRPVEAFPILNLIAPEIFHSEWHYKQKFCAPKKTYFGWEFKGLSNGEELNKLLKKIMIRRKKEDVLKDLPPMRKIVIPFEINNRSEYDFAKNDFINWLKSARKDADIKKAKKNQKLVALDKLKYLAVQGKIKQAIEWIENFIDTGEKLVVFIDHQDIAKQLSDKFKKISVEVTGRISGVKNKQAAVDKFQKDKNCKLFIGSRAAIEGITLTAASTLVFLELYWTPGAVEQASARIHRIGQSSNNVDIFFFIAENTIEEQILSVLDSKTKMISNAIEGKDAEEDSLLQEILKQY